MSNKHQINSVGPTDEASRILGVDVARGFALFGILFVNAASFSIPLGEAFSRSVPIEEGWQGRIVFWFTEVLCAGKFYPLFSILFGAGLAFIYDSSLKSGRSFGWLCFRRLAVLAVFGIAHIALLWYGDILLLYSCVGLSMLLLVRASPRVLLIVAAIAFSFGLMSSFGLAALSSLSGTDKTQEVDDTMPQFAREMPEGNSPIEKLCKVLSDWNPDEKLDPRVVQLEHEIQTRGPLSNAILLRLFVYLFSLVFYLFITVWVILPCFCVGAALAKNGFFSSPNSVLRSRLMVVGLTVGLPVGLLATYATTRADDFQWMSVYIAGSNISGPLLALTYLSAVLSLVEVYPSSAIAAAIGQLGRMGLTGYLLESFMMSALMSHWGLALFGSTTSTQRAVIVVAVYLCIVAFANLWMHRFCYGPVEWFWRSLTYLKWQPMVRP